MLDFAYLRFQSSLKWKKICYTNSKIPRNRKASNVVDVDEEILIYILFYMYNIDMLYPFMHSRQKVRDQISKYYLVESVSLITWQTRFRVKVNFWVHCINYHFILGEMCWGAYEVEEKRWGGGKACKEFPVCLLTNYLVYFNVRITYTRWYRGQVETGHGSWFLQVRGRSMIEPLSPLLTLVLTSSAEMTVTKKTRIRSTHLHDIWRYM